jgi:hypothetical protein
MNMTALQDIQGVPSIENGQALRILCDYVFEFWGPRSVGDPPPKPAGTVKLGRSFGPCCQPPCSDNISFEQGNLLEINSNVENQKIEERFWQ